MDMHLGKGFDFVADELDAFAGTRHEQDVVFDIEHVFAIDAIDKVRYNHVFGTVCGAIEDDVGDLVVSVEIIEFQYYAAFGVRYYISLIHSCLMMIWGPCFNL